jgi:hypothetical protein
MTLTENQNNAINEMFCNNPPQWLEVIDEDTIKVRVDGEWETISKEDVNTYFDTNHGMSGYRYLGSIGGDWRPIDELAETCFLIFETIKNNY